MVLAFYDSTKDTVENTYYKNTVSGSNRSVVTSMESDDFNTQTFVDALNTNISSINLDSGFDKLLSTNYGIELCEWTLGSNGYPECGNSSSTNYYIFTDANGTSYASKAKLYNAKIYNENHTLIRNFIPCYRKSDNIIGLYDMISKTFYTNSGTEAFSKGANVPNDYHDIMSSQHSVYGTAQNLTANTYTKEGYTFTGWNTEPDGSGTSYTDEQLVNNLTTVNGDVINLYAQWEEISISE